MFKVATSSLALSHSSQSPFFAGAHIMINVHVWALPVYTIHELNWKCLGERQRIARLSRFFFIHKGECLLYFRSLSSGDSIIHVGIIQQYMSQLQNKNITKNELQKSLYKRKHFVPRLWPGDNEDEDDWLHEFGFFFIGIIYFKWW